MSAVFSQFKTQPGLPCHQVLVAYSLNSLGCCSSSPPMITRLFSFTLPVKLGRCERGAGEDGEERKRRRVNEEGKRGGGECMRRGKEERRR